MQNDKNYEWLFKIIITNYWPVNLITVKNCSVIGRYAYSLFRIFQKFDNICNIIAILSTFYHDLTFSLYSFITVSIPTLMIFWL